MKNKTEDEAKRILTDYLEQNNCRKTPERFAVLGAIYGFKSKFSIQDLISRMIELHFPVSRATVYNSLKLFVRLRLVVCIRLQEGVFYEAYHADNHCSKICTVCGKMTEVKSPELLKFVGDMHLKRFRKENFTMYIYGICSTCQAKITRINKNENKKNKNKLLKENENR